MKLIYIDPNCSGLCVADCKDKKDIEKVLTKKGIDEDTCGGETIYYIFVSSDGRVYESTLDFT